MVIDSYTGVTISSVPNIWKKKEETVAFLYVFIIVRSGAWFDQIFIMHIYIWIYLTHKH